MASSHDNLSMAVFCDFENVALGVRDANYEKFDIKPILEKLLLKGSIVVKKAYCDWDRYKGHKATMHEANFELIEIPHVRQSGKNSADIRMVVDALDLCYTKSHVNTFVIISGDSDFSPLVSKLRENAKTVIGVGIKQSTSDLLVANCDEFIFYDDLVRERQRQAARKQPQQQQPKRSTEESSRRKEELESRKSEAIDMVVETFDALTSERGDSGKIWASLLKDTLKRRRPDFNETYYGFRTFGNLLEEAQGRGLLEFGRDEKSGAYVYRPSGAQAAEQAQMQQQQAAAESREEQDGEQGEAQAPRSKAEPRRRTRGGRKPREEQVEAVAHEPVVEAVPEPVYAQVAEEQAPAMPESGEAEAEEAPRRRPARKAPARKAKAASKTVAVVEVVPAEPVAAAEPEPRAEEESGDAEAKPKRAARKPAARSRRPAKPKAA